MTPEQLSMMAEASVTVTFFPSEATLDSPNGTGVFVADVEDQLPGEPAPTVAGAIEQLAEALRRFATEHPGRGASATGIGRALLAAERLTHEELVAWLAARAQEPQLADGFESVVTRSPRP